MNELLKVAITFGEENAVKQISKETAKDLGLDISDNAEVFLMQDYKDFFIDYEQTSEGFYGFLGNDNTDYIDDVMLSGLVIDKQELCFKEILHFVTAPVKDANYPYALILIHNDNIEHAKVEVNMDETNDKGRLLS